MLAKLKPRLEPEPSKTVDPKPADIDPDVTIVKPKEPSAEDAHGDDLVVWSASAIGRRREHRILNGW